MKTKAKPEPSLMPQNINEDSWYYEYRSGIHIVIWNTWGDGTRHPADVRISWRKLIGSLRRCKTKRQIQDEFQQK